MSWLALFLVLTAAVCHATWNLCVKKVNGGAELVWLFSLIASILYLPAAVYILWTGAFSFRWIDLGFIVGSAILHLGYFSLLQAGYRNGDLSLVYPTARATGPFLSVLMAVFILGEAISTQTAIGAAIIIFGIVNLTGGLRRRPANVSASLFFGIATGIFIGTYTVWDAYAVATLLIPPLLLDYGTVLTRCVLLTPVGLRRIDLARRHWREHRLAVLGIAVLSPLAYILVLYAMTFTPVIYVAPLRETSVLLSVLMGSLLLGEGHIKQRLSWAIVILIGVSLLATG